MKKKALLRISVALNIVLVTTVFSLAYSYRDRLLQYYVRWNGNYKIIMYGDSMTSMGNWMELLGRSDVLNMGMPGHCTYHFRVLLPSLVIDKNPQICFVMGGINDITVGVSEDKIQKNFTSVLKDLKSNKIRPVVTSTIYEQKDTASMAQVQRLNVFLLEYCQKNGIEYIDLNRLISDSTGLIPEFAVDKTHLNNRAYKIWAKEIDKILKKRNI